MRKLLVTLALGAAALAVAPGAQATLAARLVAEPAVSAPSAEPVQYRRYYRHYRHHHRRYYRHHRYYR